MVADRTQQTASVWTLGNTTVRNPERILGAITIFSKYYKNAKTFSSNGKQQGEFFEKLLTHSKEGVELTASSRDIPFYSYENNGQTRMGTSDYKQKNGRLWLSPLESFGFIKAYDATDSDITDPGSLYVKFPILETDIWLRQLLKFQYPNLHSTIKGGGNLRPARILFELMLELDGLSEFEIALCHLARDEKIDELKSIIEKYRKERKTGKIMELKRKILQEQIEKHYEKDLNPRRKKLYSLITRLVNSQIDSVEAQAELDEIVTLGKGHRTKKAIQAKKEFNELIASKDYDIKKFKQIFEKYYHLIKSCTIAGDYSDLTKRYLSMCRLLQSYKKQNEETRLRINPEFDVLVKESIKMLPPIYVVNDAQDKADYAKYLRDINQPKLSLDDNTKINQEIRKIRDQLTNIGWKYDDPQDIAETQKLIPIERIIYHYLFNELRKAKEIQFAKNLNVTEISMQLRKLATDASQFDPSEVEGLIWKSGLSIGGFKGHPSSTRNFHVDANFEPLFTAAGDQPDLQFDYSEFDLIIEVTKNTGKTQWRAESEPVPRHVATHKYLKQKETHCLFLAPAIHEETNDVFFKYSKGKLPHIIKSENISIKIISLSFAQFQVLYEKIISKNVPSVAWIKIISELEQAVNNVSDVRDWNAEIEQIITCL